MAVVYSYHGKSALNRSAVESHVISLQTATLVRAQAMITHVVFEHSLRIRPNVESTSSEARGEAVSSSSPRAQKGNLVGKMINLTTNDLDNILDGRDFLVTCVCPLS